MKPELVWNGIRTAAQTRSSCCSTYSRRQRRHPAGRLAVTLENLDTEPRFALAASGPMLRVPPKFLELHSPQA
jgi:histidine phosphotransferase ChpT